MYGLEKKGKGPFKFELEKELEGDPSKARTLLKTTEEKIAQVKELLRHGTGSADFDKLGVLLQGLAALQRVLNRIATKK